MKVSYDARGRQSAPETCASAAGRHMRARVLRARRRHRPGKVGADAMHWCLGCTQHMQGGCRSARMCRDQGKGWW